MGAQKMVMWKYAICCKASYCCFSISKRSRPPLLLIPKKPQNTPISGAHCRALEAVSVCLQELKHIALPGAGPSLLSAVQLTAVLDFCMMAGKNDRKYRALCFVMPFQIFLWQQVNRLACCHWETTFGWKKYYFLFVALLQTSGFKKLLLLPH